MGKSLADNLKEANWSLDWMSAVDCEEMKGPGSTFSSVLPGSDCCLVILLKRGNLGCQGINQGWPIHAAPASHKVELSYA
jgi:hypothetical protein